MSFSEKTGELAPRRGVVAATEVSFRGRGIDLPQQGFDLARLLGTGIQAREHRPLQAAIDLVRFDPPAGSLPQRPADRIELVLAVVEPAGQLRIVRLDRDDGGGQGHQEPVLVKVQGLGALPDRATWQRRGQKRGDQAKRGRSGHRADRDAKKRPPTAMRRPPKVRDPRDARAAGRG